MKNVTLPNYLKLAKPNPMENRQAWYKNTAPVYTGIFLWVGFYMGIARGTLPEAGLWLSLLGLIIAALICHFLFYLVPGLFGMKTGPKNMKVISKTGKKTVNGYHGISARIHVPGKKDKRRMKVILIWENLMAIGLDGMKADN